MTTTLNRILTLEEFLQLPETEPASEFIDGQIHQKTMPQGKHSRLQLKFCQAVNQVAEPNQIALAFPELRCSFGGRSIVPDVSVFTRSRIPFDPDGEFDHVFALPSDWVVEILSPDRSATKVIGNILYCLQHGTQLGWLIDPKERSILIFFPTQPPLAMTGIDRLPVPNFIELDLTVDRVFSWLKPANL